MNDPVKAALDGFKEYFDHKLESTTWQYYRDHYRRFIDTFRILQPHVRDGIRCLEIGGKTVLSEFIASYYKYSITDSTTSDLRYPLDVAGEKYDIVINTETVEHIKDQESTKRDEMDRFNFSGIKSLLSECHRVLLPKGKLILSTPNSVSLNVVTCALWGNPPYFYYDHVRELTPREIRDFLEKIGFNVMFLETVDCWNLLPAANKEKLIELLKEHGYPVTDRGECIFLVAEK
jgi:SAM-dependent methyltransferase